MRPVLSRAQMRQFDESATALGQVPSLLLMENAGRAASEVLLKRFGALERALVCCGAGNNGGDGFVVARRLLTLGIDVTALCSVPSEQQRGDAAIMQRAFTALGGRSESLSHERLLETTARSDPDKCCLVDAVFGTGLSREVEGTLRLAIEAMNRSPLPVLSLDIPSGLDADSGVVLGACVRAAATVSFGHLKLGLLTPAGAEHRGELELADIGVPADPPYGVGYSALAFGASDLRRWLPPRGISTHKGGSGRVGIVAGSPGTLGAARLVARGALRAGAGLVTWLNFESVASLLEIEAMEAMTRRLDERAAGASLQRAAADADVLAVGPGLGVNDTARELVHAALELPCVRVLDADALSVLCDDPRVLRSAGARTILTPHPGEAGRLLGSSAAEVEADRFKAVRQLVELTECVVLLKGMHTLVASPDQTTHVNMSGAATLATGGAGDVLTGIIAALAVHNDPFRAACLSAGLHGVCGESWQSRTGADRGMLASEVADEFPHALAQVSAGGPPLTV